MRRYLLIPPVMVFLLTLVAPAYAQLDATIPKKVWQAVVWVQCDRRQGSGTVIQGDRGYVLTNAHVAMNIETGVPAKDCLVGFLEDPQKPPFYFYKATVNRSVYQPEKSRDFAILQIGEPVSETVLPLPFPALPTEEFSALGDQVQTFGYSGSGNQLVTSHGIIQGFLDGFIETTAEIAPGDSGGAAVDAKFHLIGIPTRVVTITYESGKKASITNELVDIRAVMTWLDTYGTNEHDRFFTHDNYFRYHQNAVFINQQDLGCTYIARTRVSPTVYCLLPGTERLSFPTTETFFSWYPNFDSIINVAPTALTNYTLLRNVTFKSGSLVKSATSPRVYVVVDGFGTMRWVPTEVKARTLWGPSWSSLVHDIPDEFFTNYTIGQPLEE